MPLTQEQKDKAFRLFYGEDKNLGEIAAEFGCEICDLTPWISRSLIRGATAAEYIAEAIASFDNDPADSDFQAGYLAALFVVAKEALGMEIEDPEIPAGERIARPRLDVIEGGKP